MPIAPAFESPCDLAMKLPTMIAEFLELEQHLKRRFREDSITDIIIASLLSLPHNQTVVLTPPEPRTGGDFDLIVVEPVEAAAIQFRIQAKRLTPHKHSWNMGSYRELAHPNNSGKQSETLMRSSAHESVKTIPLYAFYNPAHVCTDSMATVSGIELASAKEVRERIKAIVNVKPKRLPYKRIGSLKSLFFPLSTILCPDSDEPSPSGFLHPSEVQRSVEKAIEVRVPPTGRTYSKMIKGEFDQVRTADTKHITSRPPRHDHQQLTKISSLPAVIRTAINQRDRRVIKANVRRPKILLISESREP